MNELINRLEKAKDEIFETVGVFIVLALNGVNAQLVGQLRGVVKNKDDIRILCNVATWSQNAGPGTFLTEDLSGSNEDIGNVVEGGEADKRGDGLPDHVRIS
ncbi:hypothetical protein [Halorussus lipolyticus]|uniref:hypothetical protein n=1 Tax=Halorussus lipolyticus TaxID=3034024 RepID=UPI0023E75D11|nr:hypothetical protein [Halorussus sp. DT80]